MVPNPSPVDPASARFEAVTSELRELVELLKSHEIDNRVLSDFRQTIDYVRMTAWAHHQVIDERTHRGDFRTVLSLLASDRTRRATQLARDINQDLDTGEIGADTEELKDLQRTLGILHSRLANLFKNDVAR